MNIHGTGLNVQPKSAFFLGLMMSFLVNHETSNDYSRLILFAILPFTRYSKNNLVSMYEI